MISFRLDGPALAEVQAAADRLGIDRSELIRDALAAHLVRLRAESDAAAWAAVPLTAEEQALGEVADWGPAEDWSDWSDAAR